MPRTRKQSNILNGGQTIDNTFTTEPALTVAGKYLTGEDAQIRLENQEGSIAFAGQSRVTGTKLPAPNASITYRLDPTSSGIYAAGDRKRDFLEFSVNDTDIKTSVVTLSAEGHFRHNGNEIVRVIENQTVQAVDTKNYYITITGDDVEGTGSIDNPWKTPHRAMKLLELLKIDTDVIIRFNFGSGEYIFNKPIRISHPDGTRIQFVGAEPFVNGEKRAGFNVGDWTVDRNNPIIIPGPSYKLFNEAGVLSADSDAISRSTIRDTDKTNNEGLLIGSNGFQTIFRFESLTEFGINGFIVVGGHLGLIDNIAIIGDGKPANFNEGEPDNFNTATGIMAEGYARDLREGAQSSVVIGKNVAIHNFDSAGIAADSSIISCLGRDAEMHTGLTITGCGIGAKASHTSSIFIPSATIQGCDGPGILCSDVSYVSAPYTDVSGCGESGITSKSSSQITADNSRSTGNAVSGFYSSINSGISGINCTADGNHKNGIHTFTNGSLQMNGIHSVGNNEIGCFSNTSSALHLEYDLTSDLPLIANNGTYGICASVNSVAVANNIIIEKNGWCGVLAVDSGHAYIKSYDEFEEGFGGQRTRVGQNGAEGTVPVYQKVQVVGKVNSSIDVCGSAIQELNNTATDHLLSIDINSTGMIGLDSYNETDFWATITGRALVLSNNGSFLYDENSNLGGTAEYYSPAPNTIGNHNSYCRTT